MRFFCPKSTFMPLAALLIVLAAAGCAVPWETASTNINNSKALRVGMTKDEVLAVMGKPVTGEVFCSPNRWYYYIEPVWVDGLTTEDECMPLVFEKGVLIGWGRNFYARYRIERKEKAQDVSAAVEKATGKKAGK